MFVPSFRIRRPLPPGATLRIAATHVGCRSALSSPWWRRVCWWFEQAACFRSGVSALRDPVCNSARMFAAWIVLL